MKLSNSRRSCYVKEVVVYMTVSLQIKNNKYYAVLNFKDTDGKRRQKWISLDMEVKNNKRKAEQALKKLVAEYEAKKIDIINKQSFSDFMNEWLKVIKTSVKITTYNGYKLHYDKHIKPYFDKLNVAITDLTPMHIQNYYNSKISEGLSASTVKRHHANIHKALDYALKMNIIPYNPADRITLPKREHYTGKFYDDIQLKRLMELCTNTPIESCVFLTINYGLRRSEVLGLKWSAVNFSENTITINHTAVSNVGGVIYADTTKTKASLRTLPLTDGVREYLLRLKAHQEAMEQQFGDCYHKSEYVCTYDDGREIRPDYVTHKFAKILAKSDDLPKIRFHDLRHSAASLLINSGFNLKEVQEWLGHSDISTTGNIYSHLQYSAKINMANRFNELLTK